ncbi:NitT/TauT family transport system ATP-binding protein [Paenibacillus phyllosphaerae]|uniref:NitT/TauT family transport system ATP-binding protein n=1 Tax=Paenibacillus phyllosphaerae TaxID=274593 RepID=A0A7W5AX24_9BACL|nr:ABC transporter ATP-binding protein [Paenibacillus phyllosphaerae]MBB3110388.1 NitT/TauT family transport system ATP-binding protein [Paenibacillus phyllosphaerae]
METLLKLEEVTHVYVGDQGASLAVENLSLSIGRGEFVSLVGPSGCGKTTILSLLAGLLTPTKGTVYALGEPVRRPSPKLGYMLQQDYLFPWRTILENAQIGLELNGIKTPAATAHVRQLLHELGLGGTEQRMPYELSGGMRQRAALVRTLATEPDVLLLDEPFSALDMHIKLQLEDLVHTTLEARGKTAVLVTHDLAEAAAMSDRVVVLAPNPGRIQAIYEMPKALRELPPTEARKQPEFQGVFEQLWEALESGEAEGGEA